MKNWNSCQELCNFPTELLLSGSRMPDKRPGRWIIPNTYFLLVFKVNLLVKESLFLNTWIHHSNNFKKNFLLFIYILWTFTWTLELMWYESFTGNCWWCEINTRIIFYPQVYENSPSTASNEVTAVSQAAKSTYPCKKCGVVFNGYYELVKHQKRVCMKNNVVPLPFGNQVRKNVIMICAYSIR